jgi:hypothetical protein
MKSTCEGCGVNENGALNIHDASEARRKSIRAILKPTATRVVFAPSIASAFTAAS